MRHIIWIIIAAACRLIYADNDTDDTGQRIIQQAVQAQYRQDSAVQAQVDALDNAAATALSPQQGTAAALYQALQEKNWPQARVLLVQYARQRDADPMLLGYARGVLAREAGDYRAAIAYLRGVVAASPADFLLPKLALGRALFEDRQNAAAGDVFSDIRAHLDPSQAYQQGVIHTVALYQDAIDKRQGWQGAVGLAFGRQGNVNQTSESLTCLLDVGDFCAVERKAEARIDANYFGFDAMASRRFTLAGHHGVIVRGLAFGRAYQNQPHYHNFSVMANVGYSYQNAHDQFSFVPAFKYVWQGQQTDHRAWGANLSWQHSFDRRRWLSMEADIEQQRYPQEYRHYDGTLGSVDAGVWQGIGEHWLLYGGIHASRKQARSPLHSYRRQGLSAGAVVTLPGENSLTLRAAFDRSRYDEFNAVLGVKRRDDTQHYSAALHLPGLSFAGIAPSINFTHNRRHSNVDWLYSYQQSAVYFRFEKRF